MRAFVTTAVHVRAVLEVCMQPYLSHSVAEAAKAAGLGRSTIYEAITKGALRARKHGKRTLILHDDLRDWLDSLPCISGPAPQSRSIPR